jgi:hypothetical protein
VVVVNDPPPPPAIIIGLLAVVVIKVPPPPPPDPPVPIEPTWPHRILYCVPPVSVVVNSTMIPSHPAAFVPPEPAAPAALIV